jgi:hypothetical protein
VFALWWSVAAAACSSPTGPGVSVVAAKPTSPSNGSTFSYYTQPVTLVVTAGVATGGALPTSTVEVATDAAFTTLVTTQTVSAGATGQVTVTLDHLSPATTYYWRVKTASGNNPGVYSSPASFSIGRLLVIQSPTLVQPLADTFPHKRPTFIVTNAARTVVRRPASHIGLTSPRTPPSAPSSPTGRCQRPRRKHPSHRASI